MNIATLGAPSPSAAAQGLAPAAPTAPEGFGAALNTTLQAAAAGPKTPAAPQPAIALPSGQPILLEQAAAADTQPVAPMIQPAVTPSRPADAQTQAAIPQNGVQAVKGKGDGKPGPAEQQPISGSLGDATGPALSDPAVGQQKSGPASAAPAVKTKDEAETDIQEPEAPAPADGGDASALVVQPPIAPSVQPKPQEGVQQDGDNDGKKQKAEQSSVTAAGAPRAESANAATLVERPKAEISVAAAGEFQSKKSMPKADTKAEAAAPRADAASSTTAAGPAMQMTAPSRTAAASAALPAQPIPATQQPVVTAQPGRIGHEMGVEIARHASAGKDELLVRLNPQSMGRIEVRMSFDDQGSLRAVVSADSPAALDMLRRDAGDLGRTLADAGVRADLDSFRFTSRNGGSDGNAQMTWQNGRQDGGGGQSGQQQRHRQNDGYAWGQGSDPGEPDYRRLRTSGQVDLMA